MICVFESGHALSESAMGLILPRFTVRRIVSLTVMAGEEATEAVEPSVFLETAFVVNARWYMQSVEPPVPASSAPAPTARRRRGEAAPVAPAETSATSSDILLGKRTVLIDQSSENFLNSAAFESLAEARHKKDPNFDFQAHAMRTMRTIVDLHGRVRDYLKNGGADADPMLGLGSDTEDPRPLLADKITYLNKLLAAANVTGSFLLRTDAMHVARGLFELRDMLESLKLTVSEDDLDDVMAFPIRAVYSGSVMPPSGHVRSHADAEPEAEHDPTGLAARAA